MDMTLNAILKRVAQGETTQTDADQLRRLLLPDVQLDTLAAAIGELKFLLAGDDYGVARVDGEPMGIGDALRIGNILERIDAALALVDTAGSAS